MAIWNQQQVVNEPSASEAATMPMKTMMMPAATAVVPVEDDVQDNDEIQRSEVHDR